MHKYQFVLFIFIFSMLLGILWFLNKNNNQVTVVLKNVSKNVEKNQNNNQTTVSLKNVFTKSTEDYNRLINLTNFKFLKLTKCKTPIKLLVVIHSAPENSEKRQVIRETWGKTNPDIKVVFAIGLHEPNEEKQINTEQKNYNDFIQGNFIDSYKNLTYKHVMVLKYATYFCSKVRFILKTDDDVFINMPVVTRYINNYNDKHIEKLVYCRTMYGSPAIREPNKWQVSFEEFPDEMYPPYCSGFGVLYSQDAAKLIYRAAQKLKYFWIDDVMVTGMARIAANIELTPMLDELHLSYEELITLMKINNSYPYMHYAFLIGPMNMNSELIRNVWNLINNRKTT